MSASQRRKGANGERELCRLLGDLLGHELYRNLDQARSGGHDVLGLKGWAVEVKRAKQSRVASWWSQCCEQAEAAGLRPVLLYRLDRMPWRAVLALRDVATGFENAPWSMFIETDLAVFAALVRETL